MTAWPRSLLQGYFLFRCSQDNFTIRSERTSVEKSLVDQSVTLQRSGVSGLLHQLTPGQHYSLGSSEQQSQAAL